MVHAVGKLNRLARARRLGRVAGFFVLACGCVDPDELHDTQNMYDLDYDLFVARVQPVLTSRCSQGECHGSEARPFRVYATGELRAPDAQAHPELTEDELWLNYLDALAFAILAPNPQGRLRANQFIQARLTLAPASCSVVVHESLELANVTMGFVEDNKIKRVAVFITVFPAIPTV